VVLGAIYGVIVAFALYVPNAELVLPFIPSQLRQNILYPV
jgi:hypothetical protein